MGDYGLKTAVGSKDREIFFLHPNHTVLIWRYICDSSAMPKKRRGKRRKLTIEDVINSVSTIKAHDARR